MSGEIGRRALMGAAGAAVVAGTLGKGAFAQESPSVKKVIAVSTSLRAGKTTAAGLTLCLEAAKEQDPSLETELIELSGLNIPPQVAGGLPLKEGETDDFPAIAEKLCDPAVVGILVGSPVYFNNMSALCKAFIDRCIAFRKNGFELRNKVFGALAVGGARNGGQELTVSSIHAGFLGQDLIVVGDGKPSGRIGATLWNQNDSIAGDEFGVGTARGLGRRVAELAGLINR
ncbi:MAG TPA: flavodoxin family protein [Candidatus Hydrogenedentes bacterium]|nr:flavodoxin family protein [Candidatus Hydrogenedentota bacterium]HQE82418.1 flavodoxin family protein [Candidatus Hydrogenedentota bacterium]HQH54122.1 flavodoxin family protein [Candidatus Hydrogenedentota bacterium]HQM48783.1 flavodoxin family protein [Candidatus Hydrogenedentota bacterium]